MSRAERAGAAAEQRASDLQRRARAANEDMRPTRAAALLRLALAVLDSAPVTEGSAAVRGRVLITLGITEAELGDSDRGLSLLGEAESMLVGEDRAVLYAQRAILQRRRGRDAEALPDYDAALRLLDEKVAPQLVARVLLNRAVLHTASGRLSLARSDLARCAQLAADVGDDALVAKAGHNLGWLDWAAGDLPAALRQYELTESRYRSILPGNLPMLSLDRARVLLAAGLISEADSELAEAVAGLRRQRSGQDYAEGLLTRAEVALVAGRPRDASRHAQRAASAFTARGNERWAGRAALVEVQAAQARHRTDRQLVARADAVHGRLAASGLPSDAQLAALVAARAHLAYGEPDECRRLVASAGRARSGDARVYGLLVRSELAAQQGRRRDAQRYRKAVLAELDALRESLGALDLRAGTAALGADVTEAGRVSALADGKPSAIFAWAELSRAQSLLMRPVRPEAGDPNLQQLRAVTLAEARTRLDGFDRGDLRTERDRLRRLVQRRTWSARGVQTGRGVARLSTVRDLLEGACLVTYLRTGGALQALAVTASRFAVVPIGAASVARNQVARLRADLDMIAGRGESDPLHATLRTALDADAAKLSALLLNPVKDVLGDRDLVVVPTADLISVPWAVLPAAAGRPVTVAPSATLWAARRSTGSTAPRTLLLTAGPRLDHAATEMAEIAHLAAGAGAATTVLAAPTTAAVLRGVSTHDLAHLVCHGHHVTDNALFSGLEFADGLLMGYDLLTMATPPRTVVLSACDLGLADVRPGDESLGVASALLATGCATVVASVSRTGDETAAQIMPRLYRRLLAGDPVPRALATALTGEASGFICLGAG